jgi:hypothetical protein
MLLAISQCPGVLIGKATGQSQFADIVQYAGSESQFRIAIGQHGQRPSPESRADTVADIPLRVKPGALIGAKDAVNADRQHHAAYRTISDQNNRVIDCRHSTLQAIKRRIGDTQQARSQRLILGNLPGKLTNIQLFLIK